MLGRLETRAWELSPEAGGGTPGGSLGTTAYAGQ